MKLLILGAGFTGIAVARLALVHKASVSATTRRPEHADHLRSLGVTPLLAPRLSPSRLMREVTPQTDVLVTVPPDGSSDELIAPLVAHARSVVYVSSTGVYGDSTGRVDESTPTLPNSPRSQARLAAEAHWQNAGASVLRAPGIYGPGRGLHLRLARGELSVAGPGTHLTSRIHVADLARALFTLLETGTRGALYVIGDEQPAPHLEVVQWLARTLGLPEPSPKLDAEADESLKSERAVDATRLRRELAFSLAFPHYRAGYGQCLEIDRAQLQAALSARGQAVSVNE